MKLSSDQTDFGACFVTFSCYRRRRWLDSEHSKEFVAASLARQLVNTGARCLGFVIMPDHVHAVLRLALGKSPAEFVQQWKRLSSFQIKRYAPEGMPSYAAKVGLADPIWQRGYYCFVVTGCEKLLEKLNYLHRNPVRAGLVARETDWRFSSARFYERGEQLSVPISREWLG